jgi:hypothetical protein
LRPATEGQEEEEADVKIREMPRPPGMPVTPFPVGNAADRSVLSGLVAMIENNPAFCNRGVLPEEQERC